MNSDGLNKLIAIFLGFIVIQEERRRNLVAMHIRCAVSSPVYSPCMATRLPRYRSQ